MSEITRREAIGAVAASALLATAATSAIASEDNGNSNTYSLEEFDRFPLTKEIRAVLDRLNGGTFMDCHTAIREETGVWIPELVPVFQKLDAMLLFKDIPAA